MSFFAAVNLIDVPRETGMLSGGAVEWWSFISLAAGYIAMGLAPWAPLPAAGIGLVTLVIALATGHGTGAEPFVIIPCLIAVAVRARRSYLWVLAGVYAVWTVWMAVNKQNTTFGWGYGLIIFLTVILGLVARHFVVDRVADRRRVTQLEAQIKHIRSEERERLARELHDVVAHELSIIALQYTAYGDSDDPAELRTALAKVNQASKKALAELRALVGILRDLTDTGTKIDPLSILDQARVDNTMTMIATTLEEHGYHPAMRLDVPTDTFNASLHNTISRILTEASTNILRYTPAGAECAFTVTGDVDQVCVTVTSPLGAGNPATAWLSGGWGLTGLRERVNLIGGTLDTGTANNHWVVTATLPRH
ncbi:MAG: histidine kinase [Propionibacteriaceae bacterium]|nr:histidine kinase [Propionibacteriaceae bacterium]